MIENLKIEGLDCQLCVCKGSKTIAYVLYPINSLDVWIEGAAIKYGTSIAVITGMDWDNVFSPWAAPGQPPGSPDFEGKSRTFLTLLQKKVIPAVETRLSGVNAPVRSLVGVSMSGLFALWQWMVCNTFEDIASLSGSFWFPGFVNWMNSLSLPHKAGRGYFLLGNQESKSPVKAFDSVATDTAQILALLRKGGIKVDFDSVPGNHFADPIPRLDKAFTALFLASPGIQG